MTIGFKHKIESSIGEKLIYCRVIARDERKPERSLRDFFCFFSFSKIHHFPTTKCVCCAQPLSCVQLFLTLWIVASQAPWDFSGKSTGVGCNFLLQGILLTQGSNLHVLCLLHCRWILYLMSYRESPPITK